MASGSSDDYSSSMGVSLMLSGRPISEAESGEEGFGGSGLEIGRLQQEVVQRVLRIDGGKDGEEEEDDDVRTLTETYKIAVSTPLEAFKWKPPIQFDHLAFQAAVEASNGWTMNALARALKTPVQDILDSYHDEEGEDDSGVGTQSTTQASAEMIRKKKSEAIQRRESRSKHRTLSPQRAALKQIGFLKRVDASTYV